MLRTLLVAIVVCMQAIASAQFGFVRNYKTELGSFFGSPMGGCIGLLENDTTYALYYTQGEARSHYDSLVSHVIEIDKNNGEIKQKYGFNNNRCTNYLSPIEYRPYFKHNTWYYRSYTAVGDSCGVYINPPIPHYTVEYLQFDDNKNVINLTTKQDLIDILPDSLGINARSDAYFISLLGKGHNNELLASISYAKLREKSTVLFAFDQDTRLIKWYTLLDPTGFISGFSLFPTDFGYFIAYRENQILFSIDKQGNVLAEKYGAYEFNENIRQDDENNIFVFAENVYDYDKKIERSSYIKYDKNLNILDSGKTEGHDEYRVFDIRKGIWKFSGGKSFGEYNSKGQLLWQKFLDQEMEWIDYRYFVDGVIVTEDGGFLMSLFKVHSVEAYKTDCKGNVIWDRNSCSQNTREEIAIYPNPVLDELKIEVPFSELNKEVTVSIYSVLGLKLYEKTTLLSDKITKINTDFLVSATYIYHITIGDGIVLKDKFVKIN